MTPSVLSDEERGHQCPSNLQGDEIKKEKLLYNNLLLQLSNQPIM